MPQIKHTPAPWEIAHTNEKFLIHSPQGNGFYINVAKCYEARNKEEKQANVHLIAAAPELLEDLKAMTWLLERTFDDPTRLKEHKAFIKAMKTIEKAEGE